MRVHRKPARLQSSLINLVVRCPLKNLNALIFCAAYSVCVSKVGILGMLKVFELNMALEELRDGDESTTGSVGTLAKPIQ